MLKRIIFLGLALSLLAACQRGGTVAELESIGQPADPATIESIAGNYVVNGFDPLGTEYSGYLSVAPTDTPDTYAFQWIVTGSIQQGTGTLEGNQVEVAWSTVENFEPSSGTTTYTITTYGVLDGTRSVEGYEATGTETAYPNQPPTN
jgi:hypothetical protein